MEGVAVVLGCEAVRIGVRDSLSSNMALYESLAYEVVAVEPHPRGPDRVWTMAKRLAR